MDAPRDPIAAVTHAGPYPYYRDLVARRPVYRDHALGLWIVSSASAVTAASPGLYRKLAVNNGIHQRLH